MGIVKRFFDWLFGREQSVVVTPTPVVTRRNTIVVRANKGRKKNRKNNCLMTNKIMRSEEEAKSRSKEVGIRAYKCPFCDSWHLTHQKNKMKMH